MGDQRIHHNGTTVFDRFTKEPGARRRLEDALLRQPVVAHDQGLAEAMADLVTIASYRAGHMLIQQGSDTSDIFFILSGTVAIDINGRRVATRSGGTHVGEMALIDPTTPRSATVKTIDGVVAAILSEEKFSALARTHPQMWRRLALELNRRLRERGRLVRPLNDQPIVFICSSTEGLPLARALHAALATEPWITRLWVDGVFSAGKTFIESFEAEIRDLDYGLVVITPDDVVTARGSSTPSPRDNVILELGMLLGALGRERAFMVKSKGDGDLKLPTDLLGVQALEILSGAEPYLAARVAPAVDDLRSIVRARGRL